MEMGLPTHVFIARQARAAEGRATYDGLGILIFMTGVDLLLPLPGQVPHWPGALLWCLARRQEQGSAADMF